MIVYDHEMHAHTLLSVCEDMRLIAREHQRFVSDQNDKYNANVHSLEDDHTNAILAVCWVVRTSYKLTEWTFIKRVDKVVQFYQQRKNVKNYFGRLVRQRKTFVTQL